MLPQTGFRTEALLLRHSHRAALIVVHAILLEKAFVLPQFTLEPILHSSNSFIYNDQVFRDQDRACLMGSVILWDRQTW